MGRGYDTRKSYAVWRTEHPRKSWTNDYENASVSSYPGAGACELALSMRRSGGPRAAQHRQQQCFVARKTRRLAKRSQETHAPRVMKLSASVLGLALAAAELRHVAGEAGEWDADLYLHPPSTVEKFNVGAS